MAGLVVQGRKVIRGDEEAVSYIELTNLCEVFHSLPEGGGLLDQDQLIVRKIEIILQAQEERKRLDEEKEKKRMEREKAAQARRPARR